MTRFALEPDAETDNALSEPPVLCDYCVDESARDIYSTGGTFVFCSESCWRDWEQSCDEETD